MKDQGVSEVFGVNIVTDAGWPLRSNDRNGATLVEQITTQLLGTPAGQITRDGFIQLQQIADHGCNSITGTLDRDIENEIAKLLQVKAQLNAWAREVGLMIGGAMPPS